MAHDALGNPSAASTSTDDTVAYEYDVTPPGVTINQAAGQGDPTGAAVTNFTVVFTEPVTDFATGDVDLSASTALGTLVGTVTGSGATYNVAVTGMTVSGDVVASLAVGGARYGRQSERRQHQHRHDTVTYSPGPPPGSDGTVSFKAFDLTSTSSPYIVTTDTFNTGSGENRLMMVGISWNASASGAPTATISSVTFSGSGTPLTLI